MIRLLAIGNDPTIALPLTEVMGDTHQRQLKYASILESYYLITHAPPEPVPQLIQLADNFQVYPCGRRNIVDYLFAAVRRGWQIAKNKRIDVVSAQDPFITGLAAYLIAQRFNLPLSLQFAADMVDNQFWIQQKFFFPILNYLAHFLISRADTFRTVSEREKQKLVQLGVLPERIWNLGWITDFSHFLRADGRKLRDKILGTDFSKIILFVGRLTPQKDIPVLLRSFALVLSKHPDSLLVLVGDGPLKSDLQQFAKKIDVEENVRFVGMIPYQQIPDYFAVADVFALSSVFEGNARVLAEAAASAKPVVSTNVSGATDTILQGETGFVVPIKDYKLLADRLNQVLDDPGNAVRMGQRGRQHILSLYDTDRLLAGFLDLWASTVQMKHNSN